VREQIRPELKRPLTDMDAGRFANRRPVCEFSRSFVLGLFTFLWFFIVPIPGLLVFTAPGGYRFMMPLAGVLGFAGTPLGVVLAGYGASVLLERLVQHGLTGKGLAATIETRYRRFRSLASEPDRLAAAQTASLYALFTEVQTYVDQRGYACARRILRLIDEMLDAVSKAP
jgi:hypothetical protein